MQPKEVANIWPTPYTSQGPDLQEIRTILIALCNYPTQVQTRGDSNNFVQAVTPTAKMSSPLMANEWLYELEIAAKTSDGVDNKCI